MNNYILNIQNWQPKNNHQVKIINQIVEMIGLEEKYIFGRPRKYDLRSLLKLTLFAYSKGIFSSRQISKLAEENLPARWLTKNSFPSYRTVCRFRISDEAENLISKCMNQLTKYLRKNNYIDNVNFIDGTKILANANKYSFVWRKNIIRFDKLNREAIIKLLHDMNDVKYVGELPDDSDISTSELDEIIIHLENCLADLNDQIKQNKKLSPNPNKQRRRKLKSIKRKLRFRKDKLVEYQETNKIFDNRNSYSKTDHDATFMRVKEDPMLNGQLKPAYNLQIATSGQFITNFDIYQNPTDTRTLIPFLNKQIKNNSLGKYIVADAGYGSESNYRFIEDKLTNHIPLIPYGTMLKEQSRKWKSDDRKVMNWYYNAKDDYYLDPNGVRFNFNAYCKRTDKHQFTRDFKEYEAEKYDINQNINSNALTKSGNNRKIRINYAWEYFKNKQKELLLAPKTNDIYAKRKIDVESVFGRLKASLRFNRFSVRGIEKVKRETGFAMMALNIRKLMTKVINFILLYTKTGFTLNFKRKSCFL